MVWDRFELVSDRFQGVFFGLVLGFRCTLVALALWMSPRGLHPDSRRNKKEIVGNHMLNCRILVLVVGEDHS